MLHFHRAGQRIDDAREIRQQSVSGGRDEAAAVRRNQRVDRAAQPGQRFIGGGFILAHQPAEPGDIGAQNRRELALMRNPGRTRDYRRHDRLADRARIPIANPVIALRCRRTILFG